MNKLIIAFAIFGCAFAQYRPISNRPTVQQSGPQVAILKQSADVNPDGSYQWSFEAENGIAAQEQGALKGPESLEAQGSYHYTAPDGTPIQVQYVANEGGFQPQGAHLPVPPPVPAAILRALEWIAAHPNQEERQNVRPGQNKYRF